MAVNKNDPTKRTQMKLLTFFGQRNFDAFRHSSLDENGLVIFILTLAGITIMCESRVDQDI